MTKDDLLLLRQLAQGVDIRTSRPVPPGHLLLDEDVQEVLRCALRELGPADNSFRRRRGAEAKAEMESRNNSLQRSDQNRQGKRWEEPEIRQLRKEFYGSFDFKVIAVRHGRTRGAIVSQPQHMGLMPNSPA